MKIFLLGSYDLSLVNFRGNLIAELVKRGHQVIAAAPAEHDDVPAKIEALGAVYEPIPFDRVGRNPLKDFSLAYRLRRILRRHRPDVFFAYTAKPVIYGSIAARMAGVRLIASMMTGTGFAFNARGIQHRLTGWMLRTLYRRAMARNDVVFFQNPDDLNAFVDSGFVPREKTVRINGSGVDLEHFQQTPLPTDRCSFVLIARMLRDKGIIEYAEAARIIKREHPTVEFDLVGPLDPNPKGLKRDEILAWEREGILRYHDHQADVRPFLDACSAFVLPSYYPEGLPRTLLEAMAVGRPIVTTDSVGCRETIEFKEPSSVQNTATENNGIVEGKNGFLVPPRDPGALSQAMLRLINDPLLTESMAIESRRLACEKFDVNIVNWAILEGLGL